VKEIHDHITVLTYTIGLLSTLKIRQYLWNAGLKYLCSVSTSVNPPMFLSTHLMPNRKAYGSIKAMMSVVKYAIQVISSHQKR
jgi:hypothetical protein